MLEKISLGEMFYKNPKTYRKYIKYKPDGGCVKFSTEDTGVVKEFEPKAEDDLPWHPFMTKQGNIYLISAVPTKFILMLHGMAGYNHLTECMKKYASLYNNKDIGAFGSIFTPDLMNELPKYLWKFEGAVWLASTFKRNDELATGKITIYCVQYVDYGEINDINMSYSSGVTSSKGCAILQIIQLPKDVSVFIGDPNSDGSTPDRAMEIVIEPKDSLINKAPNRKYEIPDEELRKIYEMADRGDTNAIKILINEIRKS